MVCAEAVTPACSQGARGCALPAIRLDGRSSPEGGRRVLHRQRHGRHAHPAGRAGAEGRAWPLHLGQQELIREGEVVCGCALIATVSRAVAKGSWPLQQLRGSRARTQRRSDGHHITSHITSHHITSHHITSHHITEAQWTALPGAFPTGSADDGRRSSVCWGCQGGTRLAQLASAAAPHVVAA
jgi:hypothetical protein